MTTRSNPGAVHAPLGPYSHALVVPAGSELVFLSGQVGVRPDGSTPATIEAQADQAFANVVALLEAHGLAPRDIAKLTVYIVSGHDGSAVRDARIRHLGAEHPTSTTVYVPQLVSPDLLVEVDAVAVRDHAQGGDGG